MSSGKGKWYLLAAALGVIVLLNLQGRNASMALSDRAAALLKALFRTDSPWVDTHIRKLGHTAEYFLLGAASYCCFGWKGLVGCAVFSVSDQCFKEMIPVRHFDFSDLPYDMLGYVLGSCTGWVVKKLGNGRGK